jgi:hypothetical protein
VKENKMGKIGFGYGSEWHLLRHLGYHREYLSLKTLEITGGNSLEWLDIDFSKKNEPKRDDKEFIGLEFIEDANVRESWKSFWPQTGNSQNWDAVGKIHFDSNDEWLLVEAKAHIDEMESKCGARNAVSKQKIQLAFEKASRAFGNHSKPVENWLEPYYQYANRLAVLYFLMNECLPSVNARLLFIYFYGENRENLDCPQNEKEWWAAIHKMNERLGIDKDFELSKRIYPLFLHVNPLGERVRPKSKGR